MKYKMLDKDAQKTAVQQELNRLETEHYTLSVQNPDPSKDTPAFQQQSDLENKIKKLQGALRELEGEEKPATKKAPAKKAAKKAAASKSASSETEEA